MRAMLEELGFSVSRWVYAPGTVFETHTHDVDKIDGVLSGRFEVTIDGRVLVLGPGDCVRIPRGTPHRAAVVGTEAVVSLDAVRR